MIIVCLVLVVAAFVVIGMALALAELTLVNVALGLGGLSAVLLAVEFVRNRRTLFGKGRTESLPGHRSADVHGTMAGQARTDGLGKASVHPPAMAVATGPVAPAAGVGGPSAAVHGFEDTTAAADAHAPAPVSGPVRAAFSPPPDVAPAPSGADGSDTEPAVPEPSGATTVERPEDTTTRTEWDDEDDVGPGPVADGEAAARTGGDARDDGPGSSPVGDADEEDAVDAEADAEAEADRVAGDEDAGFGPVTGREAEEPERADDEAPVPADDATATGPDTDSDTTGSDDSAAADADEDGPVGTADADDTAEVAFREPAEWAPPFSLPSREESESRSVSAAAIAALAARWTPTGDELAAESSDTSDDDSPAGVDSTPSPDTGTGSADAPHGGTAASKDPED